MNIRLAAQHDLKTILAIERVCFKKNAWTKDMFTDMFKDPMYTFFAVDSGDRLVAYAVLKTVEQEAEIDNLVVHGDFRRRRIGELLLDKMLVQVTQSGVKEVFLEVDTDNLPAMALYEKKGFKKLTLRKNYYGDSDAWTYRLSMYNPQCTSCNLK